MHFCSKTQIINTYSFLNFDYRPPLIINKEKISNGECPDVDDDMRDIEIEEEEDDRCGDCPYCDSRVSITIIAIRFVDIVCERPLMASRQKVPKFDFHMGLQIFLRYPTQWLWSFNFR